MKKNSTKSTNHLSDSTPSTEEIEIEKACYRIDVLEARLENMVNQTNVIREKLEAWLEHLEQASSRTDG